MHHAELSRLVSAFERSEKELEASHLIIWGELVKAEPELASEILQLFSTIHAAARWATSSLKEPGGSPARHAAEGRAAEIMAKVRSAAHGFAGWI